MYAAGTVISTRGIEVDLQVAHRLQHSTDLQVFIVVDGGRGGGNIVVSEQPSVVEGFVDIAIVDESEGEVKAW